MPNEKEKLTESILNAIKDTYLSIEDKEEWMKIPKEKLIKLFGDIEFDEIIASRDIIECYINNKHILSICRKNNNFYIKSEISSLQFESPETLANILKRGKFNEVSSQT